MRTRLPLARARASCITQNRPALPGTPFCMNRSFPRMRCQLRELTLRFPFKPSKMSAKVFLRCAGISRVCRAVSSTQPRISLRVFQLPSPLRSFLMDMASSRPGSAAEGWAKTSSTAHRRWLRRASRRAGPPWPSCRKSSTYTSVSPSGCWNGLLHAGTGGPSSSSQTVSSSGHRARRRLVASRSSSVLSVGSYWFGSRSRSRANGLSRCSAHCLGDSRKRAFARSAIVSDIAQKVGGDCTQPMVQAMGIATSGSSPSYRGGIMASLRQSLARK